MPETGLSGSEGGGAFNPLSLPLLNLGAGYQVGSCASRLLQIRMRW